MYLYNKTRQNMKRILKTNEDILAITSQCKFNSNNTVQYFLETWNFPFQMDILVASMRKQGIVFNISDRLIPANIDYVKKLIILDLENLNFTNNAIRVKLLEFPTFAIEVIKEIITNFDVLNRKACFIENKFDINQLVCEDLIDYIDSVTTYYEFGSIKYCISEDELRIKCLNYFNNDNELVNALLIDGENSLYNRIFINKLELARKKLIEDNNCFINSLKLFIKNFDFMESEQLEDIIKLDLNYFMKKIDDLLQLHSYDINNLNHHISKLKNQIIEQKKKKQFAFEKAFRIMKNNKSKRLEILCFLKLIECLNLHEDYNRFHKMRLFKNLINIMNRLNIDPYKIRLYDLISQIH